ncbi:alpha/beta hydrolase [Olleya sp. UBA1516]|uniref:alpha/beta fold hydrolase n=1 Tax=Olleya sp. UBA1516 TaxID=1947013 RepID=UPI0025E281FA|nr:alpha/beta hydrolase [Olleya sp. UBA1516]|tara:strand:+ start:15461 stop:16234 length:774 start_codon:yes stop_codon:yes gene_type:complete
MILTYKGISIAYSVSGQGKTVTLLHGFLENSTMWKDTVTVLEKTHQVITIDLLGHGKTECLGYVHTMEDFANAINVVLIHLNITSTTLIGHSLGGYVALAFAEIKPELIKGLCLMNSTPFADSEERILLRNRAIKVAKSNYENLVSMSISNLFFEDNRLRFEKEIEHIKTEALKTPLQSYVATQEGMKIRIDRTAILENLNCKKLIIAGKNDPILSKSDVLHLEQLNGITITILDGGHMSHIENKEEFLQEIVCFNE